MEVGGTYHYEAANWPSETGLDGSGPIARQASTSVVLVPETGASEPYIQWINDRGARAKGGRWKGQRRRESMLSGYSRTA